MEATIKQSNISTNVEINIASLQSIISGALQSTKQRALAAINQHLRIGVPTLPRLYRQQLRMVNALANFIEANPVITDAALWVLGIGIVVEAFLYA